MVKPQFRQLDVESMGRLYESKERKQKKLAQLKRQREREEQQHQSRLPPTALPTSLEPDVGTLAATEAQIAGYTSADFANVCGINSLDFHFIGIDWGDKGNDITNTLGSFALPSEIGSITTGTAKPISLDVKSLSEFSSPCTPQLAQPPVEQTSREEANASPEELPLVPDLVNCSTGQIRPTSCVISELNTAPAENKGRSESGDTCESCDDDGLVNNDTSSSDEDIHGEDCSQESAVSGSKLTGRDSSGTPASHILPRSNAVAPNFTKSPSCATSPIPSCSLDVPAAPLDSVAAPHIDVFAIPTPSSRVGDATASWRKRDHGAVEDGCESHDSRLPKRRRSRNASSETAAPALPARTLRALPSRTLVDEPGKRGLTTQFDRQLRRSSRRRPRPHTAGAMSCDSHPLRPDGLPTLNVDNVSRRGKLTGRQRGRSPAALEVASTPPDFSSTRPGPQKSERVPFPRVVTTTNTSSDTCHTCGLSAAHLLRISNTVQTLAESSSALSGSGLGMHLLELLLVFIGDYAKKRLPHDTSTRNSDPCGTINQGPTLKAIAEMSDSEIVQNDESSDDISGDNSDSDGSNVSSDRSDSPGAGKKNGGWRQRRRWTPLDESRLRAWVWEEKEWSWIADKLRRSEQAIVQHWTIMGKKDEKLGKR